MTKVKEPVARMNDLPLRVIDTFDADPIYRSKDGGETSSLEDAFLDPFGRPEFVRYSNTKPHKCYEGCPHLSFDPANPTERAAALQDAASMSALGYQPNIYMENFDALNMVNNSVNKLESQFLSQSSKTE